MVAIFVSVCIALMYLMLSSNGPSVLSAKSSPIVDIFCRGRVI